MFVRRYISAFVSRMRRLSLWKRIAICIAIVLMYGTLYAIRAIQMNRPSAKGGQVLLTSLPKEFHQYVFCYDDEKILKETDVVVEYRDVDGDGTTEVVLDSGSNVRGASQSWYVILEKQKEGSYCKIGTFYGDSWFFLPKFTLLGKPNILINRDKGWTIIRWEKTHDSDMINDIVTAG